MSSLGGGYTAAWLGDVYARAMLTGLTNGGSGAIADVRRVRPSSRIGDPLVMASV